MFKVAFSLPRPDGVVGDVRSALRSAIVAGLEARAGDRGVEPFVHFGPEHGDACAFAEYRLLGLLMLRGRRVEEVASSASRRGVF